MLVEGCAGLLRQANCRDRRSSDIRSTCPSLNNQFYIWNLSISGSSSKGLVRICGHGQRLSKVWCWICRH
ncbi:hypothetical protein EUGRSUZ_L01397 [Eucalyptus grandis]|uniref:Uncharacterized protein n=1 Tax=Eucalyptus grandis TaxID=71139 RepID=A0A058ZT87_EUCGR|nr:hypothetical protein EUGRSUZ_L01397 [Eucalyptus grandis]